MAFVETGATVWGWVVGDVGVEGRDGGRLWRSGTEVMYMLCTIVHSNAILHMNWPKIYIG